MNAEPTGIPPFLDQFGREVWDNPWGQYRPNPRHSGPNQPTLRSATGIPLIPKTTAEHEPAPEPTAEHAPESTPTPTPTPAEQPDEPASREVAPATHQVTDGRITADDERIRSTIQYAKGYAKACKELGLELPEEISARLKRHTSQRRGRMHRRVRRGVAVVTAVGGGFVGITAAQAYMTSHSSGNGSGTSTTLSPLTATGSVSGNLVPDGTTAHTVNLTVSNPNPYPVEIVSVISNGAVTGAGGVTGQGPCTTTGIGFSVPGADLPQTVAANATNVTVPLANAAVMNTNSDAGCQQATFTIPVTVEIHTP